MSSAARPVYGDEAIMARKAHGSSDRPAQADLRWDCSHSRADNICNFNRHFAEPSGSWLRTAFLGEETVAAPRDDVPLSSWSKPWTWEIFRGARLRYTRPTGAPPTIDFFDSNTGQLLFTAPRGRTLDAFVRESRAHGWPSFRDEEANWQLVRCLPGGECVSTAGTHLGHNLPDGSGNRYCINLVSVAGRRR